MSEDLLFDPSSNDQLTQERAKCLQFNCEVKRMYEVLQRCENRVSGKSFTAETCEEEVVDLFVTMDHCIAKKAFEKIV